MKTIILTCISIFFIALPNQIFSQDNYVNILNINIYESLDKEYNRIIVYENAQKVEEVEIGKFYYDNLDPRIYEINKILLKYRNQGYKIVSSVRGSTDLTNQASVMVTTYLCEKDPEPKAQK